MFSRKTIAIDRTSTDLTSCHVKPGHSSMRNVAELANISPITVVGFGSVSRSRLPDKWEIQNLQSGSQRRNALRKKKILRKNWAGRWTVG
jgi:hypothetical protein